MEQEGGRAKEGSGAGGGGRERWEGGRWEGSGKEGILGLGRRAGMRKKEGSAGDAKREGRGGS